MKRCQFHFRMQRSRRLSSYFFYTVTTHPEIFTLSLHDALPIWRHGTYGGNTCSSAGCWNQAPASVAARSEEHTSELQPLRHLVCRLLLEKKKDEKIGSVRKTGSI